MKGLYEKHRHWIFLALAMIPTAAMMSMGLYLWALRCNDIERLDRERDRVELNHRLFDMGSELLRGSTALEAAGMSDAPPDVVEFASTARLDSIAVARSLDQALKRLVEVEVHRRTGDKNTAEMQEITLGSIDLLASTASRFEALFLAQEVGEPLDTELKLAGNYARETVTKWEITRPSLPGAELPESYLAWEATLAYQSQLDADLGLIVSKLNTDEEQFFRVLESLSDSRRQSWDEMNAVRETDPLDGIERSPSGIGRNEPMTERIRSTLRADGLEDKYDLVMAGFKYNDILRTDIQRLYRSVSADFDLRRTQLVRERDIIVGGTVVVAVLMALLVGLTLAEVRARRVVEAAHASALDRLASQALRDTTTGAWNRRHLESQLEADLAGVDETEAVVVAYLDLDRFKAINDVWGHAVGDKVLQTVAKRLGDIEYSGARFDLVRFGGDEFVLHSKTKRRDGPWLAALGDYLLHRVNQPFLVENREYEISASVGLSMSNPGSTMHSLLVEADSSLLMAKQSSRGSAVIYNRNESRTGELVDALPQAMAGGEIQCHFQLVICSCCGAIEGAEALARWCRSNGEWVSPAEFIPLVESFGLTDKLTETVLGEVAKGLAEVDLPERIKISVNLSAHELEVANFSQRFNERLNRLGIDPHRLVVELTETAAVGDPDRLRRQLKDLREIGVGIAVDDFGNGYSPLGYLHELPIDLLKLDRSLVAMIDQSRRHQALVKGIVGMLEGTDIRVIAEGVEREEEERWLYSHGIHRIQGFYRARPKGFSEIDWTRKYKPCELAVQADTNEIELHK